MVIVIVEVTKLLLEIMHKRLAGHEYADISRDLGMDARM